MLAAALGYNAAAALLAGYVTTKIAGTRDVMLAGIGAAIQTAALVWGFTGGEYAAYTPVWTRIAPVALTGPAMGRRRRRARQGDEILIIRDLRFVVRDL